MLFFVSSAALAVEQPAESAAAISSWKGEAEAGGVMTSGNTATKSLKTRLRIENERRRWRHSFKVDSYYSESSDGSGNDAQRLAASANSAFKFSGRGYAFAEAEYENDRFSGYRRRLREAAGLGRKMVDTQTVHLNVEAGPGGRHSQLEDGSHTDELVGIAAARLKWKIGASSEFAEDVSTVSGEEDTVISSGSAFKTSITGSSLSLKVSLDIRWNSNPPEGKEKTDTTTSVTLVYDF